MTYLGQNIFEVEVNNLEVNNLQVNNPYSLPRNTMFTKGIMMIIILAEDAAVNFVGRFESSKLESKGSHLSLNV